MSGICVLTMIRKGMMKMTEQEMMELFAGGFDCSQVALVSAADRLGIEREEALKLSSAFEENIMMEKCPVITATAVELLDGILSEEE